MKSILNAMFAALVAVLCTIACADDPAASPPTETVLSKKFHDGKLVSEYEYNSDKQLERILEYDDSNGELKHYTKFEYDTRGYLQTHIAVNADGEATSKTQYLKDTDGKLIGSDLVILTGTDSGKVVSRHKFEYNEEGYVRTDTWLDLDTDEEESYREFFYYPNGNLERYEYYGTVVPVPEKDFEVRYSPAGRPLPESLSVRKAYPINLSLYLLVAEQIQYETFDTTLGTVGEHHELISDRVYDDEGFVIEQTVTYKYILPVKPDEVVKMNFEYKKI